MTIFQKLIRYKSHPLVLAEEEFLSHFCIWYKPKAREEKESVNNNKRNQAKASKNTSKQSQQEDTAEQVAIQQWHVLNVEARRLRDGPCDVMFVFTFMEVNSWLE